MFELLALLAVFVFGTALFVFWLIMPVDAATRCPADGNQNVVWVLIVLLLGPLGAAVYAIVQRPRNPGPG